MKTGGFVGRAAGGRLVRPERDCRVSASAGYIASKERRRLFKPNTTIWPEPIDMHCIVACVRACVRARMSAWECARARVCVSVLPS